MKNFSALALSLLILCLQCLAQETATQPEQPNKGTTVDWAKIAELGDGVQKVEFDENGQVKSFVVVGTSPISTALGIARGRKVATQKARLNAKAELVKWLKEKVASVEQAQEETIIQLKGTAKDDMSEEGKATEHFMTQVDSIADGIIRGMMTVYSGTLEPETDGGQTQVIILGWSKKYNQAAKEVSAALAEPVNSSDENSASPSAPKPANSNSPRIVPPKSVISPVADEF